VEFVAEIGSNHKGIPALAYEMIRQFSQAGATICKFQLGHEQGKCEDKIQRMRHAPTYWAKELAEWCDYFGVEFMASIWSQEGLDAARSVSMRRYKIAHQLSEDSDRLEFYNTIVADGKETFVSTSSYVIIPKKDNVKWLWCPANYPTYPDGLEGMPDKFEHIPDDVEWPHYGYSSHSHGVGDALLAISRGARYIEKHVTLSKAEESIRDNSFSLSPREFAEMVRIGKEIHRLIS
jgi:sialic acid synthase SpsE